MQGLNYTKKLGFSQSMQTCLIAGVAFLVGSSTLIALNVECPNPKNNEIDCQKHHIGNLYICSASTVNPDSGKTVLRWNGVVDGLPTHIDRFGVAPTHHLHCQYDTGYLQAPAGLCQMAHNGFVCPDLLQGKKPLKPHRGPNLK